MWDGVAVCRYPLLGHTRRGQKPSLGDLAVDTSHKQIFVRGGFGSRRLVTGKQLRLSRKLGIAAARRFVPDVEEVGEALVHPGDGGVGPVAQVGHLAPEEEPLGARAGQ